MALTRPSHFSIFTSLYPREHGVLNNAMTLPDSEPTLAEIYLEHGYRTGGFVAVSLLGRDSGVARGFEEFHHPTEPRERPAEEVVREALRWVKGLRRGEPFFLWVHLFDPHQPYAPPAKYRKELDGKLLAEFPGLKWSDFRKIAEENGGDIPREIYEHARGLYRGEVEYTDHWIGELLEGLGDAGRLERTITVFTADHGESFENGVFFEHADSLFDGAIRVPLIISDPSLFPSGTRVSTQASTIDIAPTLLAASGIEVPASFSGRPLQDLGEEEDRYVVIQHPFYQQERAENRPRKMIWVRSVAGMPVDDILVDEEKVGLVGRDWKILRTGEAVELYSLAPRLDEETNRAASEEELRVELLSRLEHALERHPINLIDVGEINDEMLETLRALGYVE
jgi:arylsulfatase A-like enzyme